MSIEGLDRILATHALFAGLDSGFLEAVAGCARNRVFAPGAAIARQGDAVDHIFLVRSGQVALGLAAPGRAPVRIQTVGEDEVVGLSWLLPPYRWAFDVDAVDQVRTIDLDAECLRTKCEADPAIGYAVMKRFVPPAIARLQDARLQMLDVYGPRR